MKRRVISDIELRSRYADGSRIVVDKDDIITPAAMDYIRLHSIELVSGSMTVSKIPDRDGRAFYKNLETGEELDHKPEEMTHLAGNILVSKTHPRIRLRGELDSLIAEVVWTQSVAVEEDCPDLCRDLDEVLAFLRRVMAAEVKDEPLSPPVLLGMDSAKLRYVTHHLKEELGIEHPVPGVAHGRMCAALNRLRTCVRKAELAASVAFASEKGCSRVDIVEALNRLSSCVYIMFCRIVSRRVGAKGKEDGIPVEVSARHVHLTAGDVESLFGRGYKLTPKKRLSQPGEFLSNERVQLAFGGRSMENVAVLGPERPHTQVELSATDARALGVDPPLRLSGNLEGSVDMLIAGRVGRIHAKECAIVAKAHIHMTVEDASKFGVSDGQRLSVRLDSERPVILEDVIVRVKDKSKSRLAMHIDFDEANAACVGPDTKAFIIKRW